MAVDENIFHSGAQEKTVGVQLRPRKALGEISNTFTTQSLTGKDGAKKASAIPTKRPASSNIGTVARARPTTRAVAVTTSAVAAPKQQTIVAPEPDASFSSRMASAMEIDMPAAPAAVSDLSADLKARVDQIDAGDRNDAQCVSEYINDIFQYLKQLETSDAAPANYMASQTDINERMRAILVDWLVEVHLKFKLLPETLFLTINLIDRFLAIRPVTRQKLQLVGVTASLIASKFEEIYPPEVRDFVYICDKAYSREEILEMESTMLSTLGFNLSLPTARMFLPRMLKLSGALASSAAPKELEETAQFLLELTLQEYKFLKYTPSHVASSALYIALKLAGHSWTPLLEYYTSYSEAALSHCVKEIQELAKLAAARSLTAVYKKYSTTKHYSVSKASFDF
eukprot:CAMPEP_0184667264 /NCGR_PEP_ID=MMETSP0308-20130426/66306_1 /TAXON_ID=38269 /ORGANISM="Gloeochaete witrockiana, Strain SAG 46.84" /LENGTH=398 /DNA_ID=CAMNT_0027112353 /DNA_START=215 /DNA_END=1411 /DNA_ORIENTATION=-